MKTCSIDTCDKKVVCRGWCTTHYSRWQRHGDPTVCIRPIKARGDGIPHGTSHGYGYWGCRCDECREFARVRSLVWSRKNPSNVRGTRLIREYGITQADYERMRDEQGGRCAICDQEPPESTRRLLYVDHCHETGRVRGLLCQKCNTGLGMFNDKLELVVAALAYLEQHAALKVVV